MSLLLFSSRLHLVIILLTIVWLLRPRPIGIEIADKFLTKFLWPYSQEPNPQSRKFWNASENRGEIREKRRFGSPFRKTHFRIKKTDFPYGRGHENVCREVFYCRSSHGNISSNSCFILGWNRLFKELRRSFLTRQKLGDDPRMIR